MLIHKLNSYLICNFISGDVITGVPYMQHNGEPAPVDEKTGLPYLLYDEGSFKYNGRGRLLTAINQELDVIVAKIAGTGDEKKVNEIDEERFSELNLAYRDLAAYLAGVSVHYEPEDPIDNPHITYRTFHPDKIYIYPNPTSPEFKEYRSKLNELKALEDSKQTVPTDLILYLTETELKLFDGAENELARAEKMDERVRLHLSNPLIRELLLRTLYSVEQGQQLFGDVFGDDTSSNPDFVKRASLFSNSKELRLDKEFAMPKMFSDNLATVIKAANAASRCDAVENYTASSRSARMRKTVFSTQVRDKQTELLLDSEKLAIETAEQFASQLIKVRDAKVLQTFFALCKHASIQDTAVFRNVPISELMELVLKPTGPNKFNKEQRREFSEILHYIAAMSISVAYQTDVKNAKSGKVTKVLREEKGVKIFRLIADYSIKKQFQSIPKSELQNEHYDKSVITSFSGEILPGNPQMFSSRANVYFDSLLHLDANKDSKAILLGFVIQTRFNQFQDKEKSVEYDRAYLIDLCDYTKTDNTKPSQATKQIENTLAKLVKAGIISKFSGLSNDNASVIKVIPPRVPATKKEAK